jgi:hypothetical protein
MALANSSLAGSFQMGFGYAKHLLHSSKDFIFASIQRRVKQTMPAKKLSGQERSALIWGIGFFLLAQLSLTVVIDRWRPEWSDPEYGYRLRHLCRRIKDEPKRPLLVVLGSSRISNGFEADCLPPASWKGDQVPIVFNMSMAGSTPTCELLILKRLLAVGIHPRWVVIEVLPPLLNWEHIRLAERDFPMAPNRLRWSDLEILDHYAPQHSWYRHRNWLRSNLLPWYSNRFSIMSVVRSRYSVSPQGWSRFPIPSVTPEQYEKNLEFACNAYSPMMANFRIAPEADRLLREMLDTCRQNAISVIGLLRMPESTGFRNLYSPEASRMIDTYLKALCNEYGTESINASQWLSDDCFVDGHHQLAHGAERFTLRLWDDVLERHVRSDPSTLILSQAAAPNR